MVESWAPAKLAVVPHLKLKLVMASSNAKQSFNTASCAEIYATDSATTATDVAKGMVSEPVPPTFAAKLPT